MCFVDTLGLVAAQFSLPKLAQHDCPRVRRLLEVNQEFRERLGPGVAEKLADPGGASRVGQHQDVKKDCAGGGTNRVEAVAELALDVFEIHADPDSSARPSGPHREIWRSTRVAGEVSPFVRSPFAVFMGSRAAACPLTPGSDPLRLS
jgi:hypothetical protein